MIKHTQHWNWYRKRRCKFFATNLATKPSPWEPVDRIIEENWAMDEVQKPSNSENLVMFGISYAACVFFKFGI
jgi:hypothetical protein